MTTGEIKLPPPPERVGPYRIENRLGVGGMGAVYRAFDERLKRPVAIKHFLPHMSEDAKAWERLRREAQAIAIVNHPAIVQIFDIVETERGDWIVMELVEGRTLHSLVEDGQLGLPTAVRLVTEVAEGLAEAHANGIVHRDLKTENIMITPAGRAKILDFGLAKLLWNQEDVSLSIEGSILGTGRAMSPEQALGDDVDHRSDLFSLGSMFYEATTGQPPFKGNTIFRTLAQVCSDPHVPARELNPEIPQELAELIDFLLEKDPTRRPQSAYEVLEQLDKVAKVVGPDETASMSTRPAWNPIPIAPMPPRSAPGEGSDTRVVPSGELTPLQVPSPLARGAAAGESRSGIHIRALLRLSLHRPEKVAERLGASRAEGLLTRHDILVRELLRDFDGLELECDEGFLLMFELPIDAVRYALAYHRRLTELGDGADLALHAGAGIHLGEVSMDPRHAAGLRRYEVEGQTKLAVERTMSLAHAGQTLTTQMAFELARRALAEATSPGQQLHWADHGRWAFAGVEEEMEVFEVSLGGGEALPPPAAGEHTRRVDAPPRRRPRALWMAAAALLVAVLAVAAVFWPSSGSTRPSLAVLGFQNLSQDAETTWLSTALAEMLTTELASGGELRLITGESIARMKHELAVPEAASLAADTLRAIRRNLGTDYVIVGSYVTQGSGEQRQVRLQVTLHDTDGGDPIHMQETHRESELFELVSQTASQVRGKLGAAELSGEDAAKVRATLPSSQLAAQRYSEGLARLRDFDASSARDALQEAVEIDPSYALAHAALSDAQEKLGYDREAAASAQRAFELAEGLPREQYLWIKGRYHEAAGESQQAITAYQALGTFFPDNVDYGLRLAQVQTTVGQLRGALDTVEQLRQLPPPLGEDPRIDLARAQAIYALQDHEQHVEATARAARLGEAQGARLVVAEAKLWQGTSLMHLGRLDEAEAVLAEAERLFADAGDRGNAAEVLTTRAIVQHDRGDPVGAEKLHRQALLIHQQTGNRKAMATSLNSLALLYQERGDLSGAKSRLVDAVALARELGDRSGEGNYLDSLVWVVYHQGDLAEADRLAREELRIYQEIGSREGQAWSHFYTGRIALAAGDAATARGDIERSVAIAEQLDSPYVLGFVLRGLVEVLLAQGDLEGALQRSQESLGAYSEGGLKGPLAESRVARARVLLELGRAPEAQRLAEQALAELRRAQSLDAEVAASVVVAAAMVEQGLLSEAGDLLERVGPHAELSQAPALRLGVGIVTSRLLAARGSAAEAVRSAESVVAEAQSLSLTHLELEARLALGEAERAAAGAFAEEGRKRLASLVEDASQRGFELLAEKARR